jgi:hypothetical protein
MSLDPNLKELIRTGVQIDVIEQDGIRSWATAIGYRLLLGKYNKLARELGREERKDIRDKFRKDPPPAS